MKSNAILKQMNEAIQYFISHKDNQPSTEFCKNVDKLINLQADLANEKEPSTESGDCPVCWGGLNDKGECINHNCLTKNGVSQL